MNLRAFPRHQMTSIEHDLRRALDQNELFLVYQPQIHLATLRLTGFEALLRWNHPERGELTPQHFLPHLDGSQLLDDIAEMALGEALAQWARWADNGTEVPVSVNVHPQTFSNLALPGVVAGLLAMHGAPPTALKIEITEEALLDRGARSVLDELGRMCIGISIDDFGAGYSSLSHLLDVELAELKIDRRFVELLPTDLRARRIVEAIVDLAAELGIAVIGEGVSSHDVALALQGTGCQFGQGYHLGYPIKPESIRWAAMRKHIATP